VIPTAFDYVQPTTIDGALSALREPGSVALAGGHHLLTRLKRREWAARRLVDLSGVHDLRGIDVDADGGVRIGALTTLTELLTHRSAASGRGPDAVTDALATSGDRQSRNRVTIGGQLASGRTGNDLAAALMVLGTTVELAGKAGRRMVALTDLWAGPNLDLRPGELITHVQLESPRTASAYARMSDPATLEAVCGVAAAVLLPAAEWRFRSCRIAAVGAMVQPGRIPAMEDYLSGGQGLDALVAPPSDVPFIDDHRAAKDYRRHMTRELARTALRTAADRGAVPARS
jgi:carbon-monoxide dehydrogenase medium subunit